MVYDVLFFYLMVKVIHYLNKNTIRQRKNLKKSHATLKQNKIKSKRLHEMLCKINEDFIRSNLN